MKQILFKDLCVEHICKPSLKHTYISINPHAGIVLKTPQVSQSYIQNILVQKEGWIRKKLHQIALNEKILVNIEDEILLFGEVLSIDSESATPLRGKLSKIKTDDKKSVLRYYDAFYKNIASKYLQQRAEYFANMMNVSFSNMKLKKLKRRWGSCSSNKEITFNTNLIKLDKKLIDYVVVHELAHLVHMNHSKSFHSLVEYYLPDSKKLREEMKKISILEI